jgi:hypothetical protein
VGTLSLFEQDVAEPVAVRAGFAEVSPGMDVAELQSRAVLADGSSGARPADVPPRAGLGIHL